MTNNQKENDSKIKWIESIAVLLDSKFSLPGTKFKFGWDPVIGLIPVLGDFSTMVVSFMILFTVVKFGGSRKLIILMFVNILLDAAFGSIPLIGSVFDFAFKSNIKNVRLLKEYYYEGKHQGSGNGLIFLLLVIVLLILFLSFFLIYKAFRLIIGIF